MQPRVGVSPGTLTLMMQRPGLGGWMDPGGIVPTSPPEPQVTFQTDPFLPQTTTPLVYLGAGAPPMGPTAGSRLVMAGSTRSVPTGVQGVAMLQGAALADNWKTLALIGLGLAVTGGGLFFALRK